ncbi:alpha/beta hydrolase [Pseudomonas sp. R2.Fl]|nr:alpha/beta hydrolase [Pseudomonas sp. R2.Fl]
MSEQTIAGVEEFSVAIPDGLTLRGRIYGPENAADTVVCLAGLTRNGRDFHQLADILCGDPVKPWRVVTIDSRGRGLSDRDPDKGRYTIPVEANDILAVCDSLGIERAGFIGTSRGGLLLHLIAGLRPALPAGVILNDIGPVIEPEGLRQIQAYLGRKRPQPRDWAEAVAAVRADHGAAFPVLSDGDWRDMARALYRETEEGIVADYDRAIADQLAAADLSKPIPDLWPQFESFRSIPLMVIRGEHSRLLSEATVSEMARRHPDLHRVTAPGQGHAPIPHIGDLPATIADFLRTCI